MRLVYPLFMLWIPALHALSGCAQLIGIDDLPDVPADAEIPGPSPDARMGDAGVTLPDGAMPDAMEPIACADWQPRPRHFDPCAIPLPSAALVLDQNGDYLYDTDAGTLQAPDGSVIDHANASIPGNPDVWLISVEHLSVSANARLRVVGGRPLLVASWSEIVVSGIIDVSSNSASSGAGANTGTCNGGEAGRSDIAGGGGGGGGLGGDGGDGGDSIDGDGTGGDNGVLVAVPDTVRGGCAGGKGGLGLEGDAAGAGGAGGGALQLTARNAITIDGRLHAGGAGGGGARGSSAQSCGGGGGGSGGLIGLEAPALSIGADAIIAANGGGGGEGAEDDDGRAGDDGPLGVNAAAGGGGGDDRGGNGGAGGAGANPDANPGAAGFGVGPNRSGGGGGGGGAGYIIFEGVSEVAGALLSPAPVMR